MRLFRIMGSATQIDNWLDSKRDIESGRALFNSLADTYQINPVTRTMINSYSNSGTQALLAEALTSVKEQIESAKRPEPKTPKKRYYKDFERDKMPPKLQQLYDNVKRWYQELDTTRGMSKALPEGPELLEKALEVIAIRKRINKAFVSLEYWDTYGIELDPSDEREALVDKLIGWLKALKNNPAYISKNKNKPGTEVQEEVRRRKRELDDINQFLAENAD